MAESLTVTTLWLYRQQRAERDPQGALEAARLHVRVAKMYATAAERWTLVAGLSDEESHLTEWLQRVRIRSERAGRSGKFWRTGKLQGRLVFTVEQYYPSSDAHSAITCESAGCAIKQAFGWLQYHQQGYAVIRANRLLSPVRVDQHTTMAYLTTYQWPVE